MKRGHYHTEAVVLNTFEYGESDVIASLYSPEFGKLKGIAKGALRSKKRFVATLAPPAHINIDFFANGKSEMVRLEDSRLIEGFRELRTDIERLTHASYMLEFTERMTREGEAAPELYLYLKNFILLVSTSADPETIVRFFEIKALKVLGFMPWLDGCVVCNSDASSGTKRVFFSSVKGGIVCTNCRGGAEDLIPISMGTAALLTAALRTPLDKLVRLQTNATFALEADNLLHDFIRHHGAVEFKTRNFLEQLKSAGV